MNKFFWPFALMVSSSMFGFTVPDTHQHNWLAISFWLFFGIMIPICLNGSVENSVFYEVEFEDEDQGISED